MPYVIDACSLIAFFQKEEGEKIVYELLQSAVTEQIFMHKATVFEVYYDAVRSGGQSSAQSVLATIYRLPIKIDHRLDDVFMNAFSEFKIRFKVSFADCFVLALASTLNAAVVSADHHEFDAVEKSGELKFEWIR